MGLWTSNNSEQLQSGEISISVFFDTTPYVLNARTSTDYPVDSLLPYFDNFDYIDKL